MIHETIPDYWFGMGKCVRQTTLRHPDGSRTPSMTEEWFLTLKFPWKVRRYSINADGPIVGHPRFILRFKPGWVCQS